MVDTCPICPGSLVHKLGAYPQESDLPFPSDHRFVDDMLSCGSDLSPKKHAVAPRNERDEQGASFRNDGLGHPMQT
jgi:hypothetical protein